MVKMIKGILVGNSGVGKTCIITRYKSNKFNFEHISTIGVDFITKTLKIEYKKSTVNVKLQLWDTAGQERFRAVSRSYYKDSDYIIFVYDITNPESFESIKSWNDDVDTYGDDVCYKVLIGNKLDLNKERKVSTKKGVNFAAKNKFFKFMEMSAYNGENLQAIFESIRKNIEDNWKGNGNKKGEKSKLIKLNNHINNHVNIETSGKTCC